MTQLSGGSVDEQGAVPEALTFDDVLLSRPGAKSYLKVDTGTPDTEDSPEHPHPPPPWIPSRNRLAIAMAQHGASV
jgi:hypothetical protein